MAFMSSLPGPVQPASQIYAKKKLHSHQTRAWWLATPTVAGNGGVEIGGSSPAGIYSYLRRPPWKMKCFAFRPVPGTHECLHWGREEGRAVWVRSDAQRR